MEILIACIIIIVVALVALKLVQIFAGQIDTRLAQALTYVICGLALIALIRALFPVLGHGHLF